MTSKSKSRQGLRHQTACTQKPHEFHEQSRGPIRRCLILACELEKHRLRHGAYPAALPILSGFETHDPARPKQPPGYRLENGGYLLWSAGPDAKNDGGVTDKDWLWRMKRTP